MAFWVSFGKKLIERMIEEQLTRQAANRILKARCFECGERTPLDDLMEGVCSSCRQNQRHKSDHRSNERTNNQNRSIDLEQAYRILECSKHDSNDQIKRQYRLLIKQCHIDRLPKGLPDYLVQAANQRFREIQGAYEMVMRSRN
ncbi:MAG: DnaJ domain-containing protein [Desulfomonilaceae bacterium]